jgi:hypothetical protein
MLTGRSGRGCIDPARWWRSPTNCAFTCPVPLGDIWRLASGTPFGCQEPSLVISPSAVRTKVPDPWYGVAARSMSPASNGPCLTRALVGVRRSAMAAFAFHSGRPHSVRGDAAAGSPTRSSHRRKSLGARIKPRSARLRLSVSICETADMRSSTPSSAGRRAAYRA